MMMVVHIVEPGTVIAHPYFGVPLAVDDEAAVIGPRGREMWVTPHVWEALCARFKSR